ncbi:hypothetical protein BU16DRAFT_602879 [Lophium mytilinum]|uniref:Uncharacterized protein n=1 Tax=Lophium mytilinum TaxID=390894 RepID=A0A6A6R7N8_9PEZI|nr:hypothetical protein BU16DRAFT_602879 [Lophium mytilinum]
MSPPSFIQTCRNCNEEGSCEDFLRRYVWINEHLPFRADRAHWNEENYEHGGCNGCWSKKNPPHRPVIKPLPHRPQGPSSPSSSSSEDIPLPARRSGGPGVMVPYPYNPRRYKKKYNLQACSSSRSEHDRGSGEIGATGPPSPTSVADLSAAAPEANTPAITQHVSIPTTGAVDVKSPIDERGAKLGHHGALENSKAALKTAGTHDSRR